MFLTARGVFAATSTSKSTSFRKYSSCLALRLLHAPLPFDAVNNSVLTFQRRLFNVQHLQHTTSSSSLLVRLSSLHSNNTNSNTAIMGSANCKEYGTSKNTESCTAQNGSYHSTREANMAEYSDPVTVCNVTDIQENEMKQIDFDENTKILLIKQDGVLRAIGNKCTHYGAPLHMGALGQGRVRCPWHGACFNIETGDIEDFPGLDSIPCHKVEVEQDGQVKVRVKRRDIGALKRVKDMSPYTSTNQRCFVVVGGGPAGAVCVETLRQEGFTGRIVMICRENVLPYDRVKVSKGMDQPLDKIQLRNVSFYEEHSIERLLGVEATKLDISKKVVFCSNGYSIKYDKIFIATGCQAYKPPIPGIDLKNIFTVRDHSDSKAIMEAVNKEKNVVCLGDSFVSMESAAFLMGKVKSVSVVGRGDVPFMASFGKELGGRVMRLYEEKGVNMYMNSGITEIMGDPEGRVVEVKLVDGSILPCDILILGTGSRFYTDFLRDSRVAINADGSINTDMYLMTNIRDVYVGGDIANAPVFSNANQRLTIGHYQLAQYHGRVAAINMAGKIKELRATPFFFTMVFGKGVRYAGYGQFSDVFIDGDLENFKFVAYYLDDNKNVLATASVGRDPVVAQFSELQYQGKRLHLSDIKGKENPTEWTNMLKEENRCDCDE